MKGFALLLSFLCTFAVAWPAAAERDGRSRDEYSQREQSRDRGQERQEQGRRDSRGYEREHLSREQREQLRRDISDHGREIYRDRRSGRR